MIELLFRMAIDVVFMYIAIYVLRNSKNKENLFCNRLRLAIIIVVCRILYLFYKGLMRIMY